VSCVRRSAKPEPSCTADSATSGRLPSPSPSPGHSTCSNQKPKGFGPVGAGTSAPEQLRPACNVQHAWVLMSSRDGAQHTMHFVPCSAC